MDDAARRSISFVWICPHGHVTWPRLDAFVVRHQMRHGGIELSCDTCGKSFPAEARVVNRLRWLMEQGKL